MSAYTLLPNIRKVFDEYFTVKQIKQVDADVVLPDNIANDYNATDRIQQPKEYVTKEYLDIVVDGGYEYDLLDALFDVCYAAGRASVLIDEVAPLKEEIKKNRERETYYLEQIKKWRTHAKNGTMPETTPLSGDELKDFQNELTTFVEDLEEELNISS